MSNIDAMISDPRTRIEMDNLIEFCSRLIIKDNDEANIYETFSTNHISYKFINSMLKSDKLEEYDVTDSDIDFLNQGDYGVYIPDKNNIPFKYQELVLELKRYQFYNTYIEEGDPNIYYKEIYEKYVQHTEYTYINFHDFLNKSSLHFYARARLARDFSILYYPSGILTDHQIALFKRAYNESRDYYMFALYNQAYKIGNEKYNNFSKLMIIFMAMKKYLNLALENVDNIDLFDEYSVRNMFLSYGLDYFFDMPLKYQKRLLKNINYLIKNKGTDAALINVLQIFGFKNIKIFRYILTKQYLVDDEGKLDFSKDPVLKFYAINNEYENVEEGLSYSHELSYEEVTEGDPYWQLSKEDKLTLFEDHFNYLNTKYIDINTMIDIVNNSMDFSYFISLIYKLEDDFRINNKLDDKYNLMYFYNSRIAGDHKINLMDALILLNSMINKKFGFKDNIVKELDGVIKIHSYNFDDVDDDIIYYLNKTYKEFEKLNKDYVNDYKYKNVRYPRYDEGIDSNEVVEIFLTNKKFRLYLEDEMIKTDNYKYYRRLKHLYKTIFISEAQIDLYGGHGTYTDFLKDRNPTLYNYMEEVENLALLNPDERHLIYDEEIMDIVNSIDLFLDSDEMDFFSQGNSQMLEYIMDFVYDLIDFIKSYTVHLRDINHIYVMDDRFLNSIMYFDELELGLITLSMTDLLHLKDKIYMNNEFHIDADTLILNESKLFLKMALRHDLNLDLVDKYDSLVDKSIGDVLTTLQDDQDFKAIFDHIDSELYEKFLDKHDIITILNQQEDLTITDIIDDMVSHIMLRFNDFFRYLKDKPHFINTLEHILRLNIYENLNFTSTIHIDDEKLSNYLYDYTRPSIEFGLRSLLNLLTLEEVCYNIDVDIENEVHLQEYVKSITLYSIKEPINLDKLLRIVIYTFKHNSYASLLHIYDKFKLRNQKDVKEQLNSKDTLAIISNMEYDTYVYNLKYRDLLFKEVLETSRYKYIINNDKILDYIDHLDAITINGKSYRYEITIPTLYLDRYIEDDANVEFIFKNIKITERKIIYG